MGRLNPRIIKGVVGHQRLRPVKHRFLTKAFYVQIPLVSICSEKARWGNWARGVDRWALLSVHSADHGDGRPLLEWARTQLKNHGIEDADGEIWLSTFPRILGYSFKPVSFWFCETQQGVLRAVIAEVNNTFGERHVYILDSKNGYRNGSTLFAQKSFYVSPFFKIEGSYSFRFFLDTRTNQADVARIVYEDEQGPLLITHMSGKPTELTSLEAIKTWLRYPIFSFSVIAKIHWHALQLWRKGLRIVPHPSSSQ